jgi:hypothetical protein
LHVGAGNGGNELLDFGVGGDGDRPWPPELHRIEACLLGGLRTLKQGQLGEQDRKVDVVWQIAPPGAPIPSSGMRVATRRTLGSPARSVNGGRIARQSTIAYAGRVRKSAKSSASATCSNSCRASSNRLEPYA